MSVWNFLSAKIIVYIGIKASPIVCFRDTGYKILRDAWYSDKQSNEQEERKRVVEEAAVIVFQDIRSQVYDITQYPPADNFFEDVEKVVPQTLRLFLEKIILTKKRGDLDKFRTKCTSIAHALISASRPRSFLAQVQTGLAAFLNRKYASSHLLNVLSRLGFCLTYKQAVRVRL